MTDFLSQNQLESIKRPANRGYFSVTGVLCRVVRREALALYVLVGLTRVSLRSLVAIEKGAPTRDLLERSVYPHERDEYGKPNKKTLIRYR